jgi:hypothetical protein
LLTTTICGRARSWMMCYIGPYVDRCFACTSAVTYFRAREHFSAITHRTSSGQRAAQNELNYFGELVVQVERFGILADPAFQGLEVACGQ